MTLSKGSEEIFILFIENENGMMDVCVWSGGGEWGSSQCLTLSRESD